MGIVSGGGWRLAPPHDLPKDAAQEHNAEDHSLKGGRCARFTPAMVASRLRRSGIVPEVCGDFMPAVDMRVVYRGGEVLQGMQLPSRQTQLGRPHVELKGLEAGELYTLLFVHADEHLRLPLNGLGGGGGEGMGGAEKLLWAVADIPAQWGADSSAGLPEVWESGEEVVPYMGSDRHTVGTHRHVFLLYKQQHRGTSIPMHPVKSRYGFSSRKFALLFGLGTPVAACFFLGSNEPLKEKEVPFSRGVYVNTV